MNKLISFYVKVPIILRIAVGLVIGAALGLLLPMAGFIAVLGDIFVGALKAIAPLLVLVLVISSLAKAGAGIGKRFRTVILFYISSTLLAAVVAVIVSYLFPVTIKLAGAAENSAPAGLGEVFRSLIGNMVQNPVSAVMGGNYVGILTWSVILGLALRSVASAKTKDVLCDISDAVSKVVGWVI
nr:cation:dicarboxylase symporter family transporter [Clostridia bacterium]